MSNRDIVYAVIAAVDVFCAIGFLVQAYWLRQASRNWDEVFRIEYEPLQLEPRDYWGRPVWRDLPLQRKEP